MFTGLIAEVGVVVGCSTRGSAAVFQVSTTAADIEIGESIACDGVCLTVESFEGGAFQVVAGEETLRRTTLGDRKRGDRLHLERALLPTNRLGGHLVQGHVDGIGVVREILPTPTWTRIDVEVPATLSRYLVEKGSVCLDGVSLTVNGVVGPIFSVGIVPHTLAVTRLGSYRVGTLANIEVDILAKYVERLLGAQPTGLTLDKLRTAGFTEDR